MVYFASMLNFQNDFVHESQTKTPIYVKFTTSFADVWRGHDLNKVDLTTLNVLRRKAVITQIFVSLMHIA